MLPNRKNLMKKSLNTAGAGIKRPSQPIPSGAKKQRLEFPKQGISTPSSASTSSASSNALNRIVELDTTWQSNIKDMSLTAKEFSLMLKANQGKAPKPFCIAAKLLLKTEESGNLDVDLFKELLQLLPKEEDAKKSPQVLGAIFALLNKLEPHAVAVNLSVLPAALQMLRSIEHWPSALLNYVLFDSMGLRLWVDKPEATAVQLAAFSVFGEVVIPGDELFQSISDQTFFIRDVPREPPKYVFSPEQKSALFKSTMEYIERAVDSGSSKPLLRTLCLLCADEQFRLLATQKLDFWLTNTKYQRHAMELILFIACNIRSLTSKVDLEILSLLSKLRLQKSRPVQNVFQRAIKEIVTNCPESLPILTEFIVENDLTSSSKAQNNIGFLQFLFTQNPTEVLKLVAKRLIMRLEHPEQLKQVRLFLKEFYRALQGAYFSQFSSALFEALKSYNGPHVATIFYSCLDLFSMLPFLAINSPIRDAAQVRRNSGNLSTAQTNILDRFQQQFQRFTLEAISAIKWTIQNFRIESTTFVDSLQTVLYLRPYQTYATDNWPTETDFNNATRIMFECAIDEKLIVTLIEMRSENASSSEILQVLKSLTMRAIQSGVELDSNRGGINVRNSDTVAKLFNLSINSPRNAFVAAKLADYELYWNCWELTFCLACMNSTLLKNLYQTYPTLRMLCAMIIAGEFNFPPQHFDGLTAEQLFKANTEERNSELNIIRQAILKDQQKNDGIKDETIRTDPSNLKLILMNPSGPIRQPPKNFLKQLKQLHDQFPFNVNLCQVDEPNILARVCADLGPQHVLPTIVTYLTSKPAQIEAVPLLCICQLYLVSVCQQNSLPIDILVHSATTKLFISVELQDAISKLIKAYLKESTRPLDKCQTVAEFLVAKLGASLADERDAACIGLTKILNPGTASALDFDPNLLKNVTHFAEFKENLCSMLATACTVEKRSNLITKYLQFIVENIDENSMHRIAPRLSAIVERSNSASDEHKTIRRNLVKFFADFMRKLIESGGSKPSQLTSPPSAHHEKLFVRLTYPKEIQVEIDGDIVKAIMELLSESFGDYEKSSVEHKAREYLMNVWFPASTKLTVTLAHDPSTTIDILPETLKMRMLSAKDERIVKVALSDVRAEQALRYIQTFALSAFSCTQLLNILNNSSIAKTSAAQAAIPFVRAYSNCAGADQFLKAAQQSPTDELKMEVDSNGPALFIPIKPPSFFEPDVEMIDDEDDGQIGNKEAPTFDNAQSVTDYLNKVIKEPESKDQAFVMSINWIRLLQALKTNLEMAGAAMTFAQVNLTLLNQEYPAILCSLLSCINGHTDYIFQRLSSNLVNEIKQKLSSNQILMSLLEPFSRNKIRPTFTQAAIMDVDMRPKLANGKEKEKNEATKEDDSNSNADLRMHFKLAEYYETVFTQSGNPQTRLLVRQLRQEVTEHIQNKPTVFARQLPLLFSHVQALLKLNVRQANEIDSYSALLHAIFVVSSTGQSIFSHTQAFETFIEIFLYSFAAHSSRSRQWESILDRLTNLMQAYLNWNPKLATQLVERNKSALFNIQRLYSDLRNLRTFMDEFQQIFRL